MHHTSDIMANPKAAAKKAAAKASLKRGSTQAASAAVGMDADSIQKAKRARTNRRGLDEQVKRLAADKMSDISEVSMHQHLVNGRSLWEALVDEKDKANAQKKNITAATIRMLRCEFGVPLQVQTIVAKDDKEELDLQLVKALQQARNPNASGRSKKMLLAWLTTVESINQRNLAGLINHCVQLRPASNATSAHVVIEILKMGHRLGVQTKFEEDLRGGLISWPPPCRANARGDYHNRTQGKA